MNVFLACRYLAFTLFIILNAITAIVAAWNWASTKSYAGVNFQVDTFIVVHSVMGLILIFPIIIVELLRKGAFLSRVCFELGWVAVFWIFKLSAAAAVTAIVPRVACSPALMSSTWTDPCSSSHTLLVFSWMATILYLVYLIGLVASAALHSKANPRIWMMSIPDVDWFVSTSQQLRSAPATPVLPIFHRYMSSTGSISTFSVKSAVVIPTSSFVKEKPTPPVPAVVPAAAKDIAYVPARPARPLSNLWKGISAPSISKPAMSSTATAPASLYPQVLRSTIASTSNARDDIAGAKPTISREERPAVPRVPGSLPPAYTPSSQIRSGPPKPLLLQPSPRPSSPEKSSPPGSRVKPRPPPLNLSGLSTFQSKRRPSRR